MIMNGTSPQPSPSQGARPSRQVAADVVAVADAGVVAGVVAAAHVDTAVVAVVDPVGGAGAESPSSSTPLPGGLDQI